VAIIFGKHLGSCGIFKVFLIKIIMKIE